MNTLLSSTVNHVFTQDTVDETVYHKFLEFVLLVDQPHYKWVEGEGIARERQIAELRFFVADAGFDQFIAHLIALRNAKPSELE